jgi:hypothetical protein
MCWPGWASWARMVSAIAPLKKNSTRAVPMVRMPIRLWSVVRSHCGQPSRSSSAGEA